MNLQAGHEILGAEEGAQMMQLTQQQLAQIVISAVNKVITQHVQQTANKPIVAAPGTTAVRQVQTPIKFDVPIFEGDSAASLLGKRVVDQAGTCGFEADLTAAGAERLIVGADVFD